MNALLSNLLTVATFPFVAPHHALALATLTMAQELALQWCQIELGKSVLIEVSGTAEKELAKVTTSSCGTFRAVGGIDVVVGGVGEASIARIQRASGVEGTSAFEPDAINCAALVIGGKCQAEAEERGQSREKERDRMRYA